MPWSWLAALFALAGASPEERAVEYLAREVPRWATENGCYSCHNNGDGARALFVSSRNGFRVPAESLRDTVLYLAQPGEWDRNKGVRPEAKTLVRIQFAAALAEASRAGNPIAPDALKQAAALVAESQREDGSWASAAAGLTGAPGTYGDPLATWLAVCVLESSGNYEAAVANARRWARAASAKATPDAAALVLMLSASKDAKDVAKATTALEHLTRSQARDGGWGPFPGTPTEVFDTAVAVIALKASGSATYREAIDRGRRYLITSQVSDGGWVETTRPSGAQSYAQRISTSAWALLALVESRNPTH